MRKYSSNLRIILMAQKLRENSFENVLPVMCVYIKDYTILILQLPLITVKADATTTKAFFLKNKWLKKSV